MSQHYVKTIVDGEPITVMLGWDRPLAGYFMVVMKPLEIFDEETGEAYVDEDYLYSNLNDPELNYGLSKKPHYFFTKLKDFDIDMPDEIFSIIEYDGKRNVGNLVKFYDLVEGVLHCCSDSESVD